MTESRLHILALILSAWLPMAPVLAADNLELAYRRIMPAEAATVSEATMKFALIDPLTDTTLWSNDGSGVAGSEPLMGVNVDLREGFLSVLLGDISIPGMAPLPAIVARNREQLVIRAWYNDSQAGWVALGGDYNVPPHAVRLDRLTSATTLYVDGPNGDDANTGLAADSAKATIMAAVNMLPRRLDAQATIRVAPGTYYEQVNLRHFEGPLRFVGDISNVPTASVSPSVILDGRNVSTNQPVRYGFDIERCTDVTIEGFFFRRNLLYGLNGRYSTVTLNRIKQLDGTLRGIMLFDKSIANLTDCWVSSNGEHGLGVNLGSTIRLERCTSINNLGDAVKPSHRSSVSIFDWVVFANRDDNFELTRFSQLFVGDAVSGSISNSLDNGIQADYKSQVINFGNFNPGVFVDNTTTRFDSNIWN